VIMVSGAYLVLALLFGTVHCAMLLLGEHPLPRYTDFRGVL
jgi:hypothetical protein